MPRLRPHRSRSRRHPLAGTSRELAERGRDAAERAAPLLEQAARRSRTSVRARARRLAEAARSVVQVALAATVAWFIATEVLGHAQPFFAPVSAIVTLGITLGERGRRAIEPALGVALGIAVADLLIMVLGTGTAQLALVVLLAMTAALLLGRGQLFTTQAAVSAALVATIEAPADSNSLARFVDGLVGGGVALATSALVLPANPATLVRTAAERVLGELASTLDAVASALHERDRAAVERALLRDDGRPAGYARERRAIFGDKERVCAIIQLFLGSPRLFDYVLARLAGRPAVAARLSGILGDYLPAGPALRPAYLWSLLRP